MRSTVFKNLNNVTITLGCIASVFVCIATAAYTPPKDKIQPAPSNLFDQSNFWDIYKSTEVQANTFTSSTQENTAVTVLPNGQLVAVWDSRRQEAGSYGIYAQRFDPTGRILGSEIHINNYIKGTQRHPDIASTNDGKKIWFTWESFGQDGASGSVVSRFFDNTLQNPSPEIAVNVTRDGAQYDPVIAVNQNGNPLIVWTSDTQNRSTANPQIYARLYNSTGQPATDEILITTQPTTTTTESQNYRNEKPTICTLPDNSFIIIWARADYQGTPTGIHGIQISNTGTISGSEFTVSQNTVASQHIEPSVDSDAQGNFVVAWLSALDGGYAVQTRKFNSDCTPINDSQIIAKPINGWLSGVAVSMHDDGRYIVAYNNDKADGDGEGIISQAFNPDGSLISMPTVVNQNHQGSQTLAIASGVHRAIWTGNNNQIAFAWQGKTAQGDESAANLTLFYPEHLNNIPAPENLQRQIAQAVTSNDFLKPIPPLWDENYVPQQPYVGPAGDGPDFGFEGVPGTGWVPPDPELAVGPDRIVVMTNGQIAAFAKDGTNMFRDEIENSFGFWGEKGATNFVFDPECCWDPHSQRFWAMACERSSNSRSMFLLAVSKTASPNTRDDWWKWRIDVTTIAGNDIDSPNMAIDANTVYLTADFFNPDKYIIYMLDKTPLLTGSLGATNYDLITGSKQQSMGIPVTYDAAAPAQYIIQSTENSSNTQVIFHAIKDPMGAYTRQTVNVNVEPYQYPNQPPQKGSSSRPYLFEPRFWSCVERNGSLWATHHVNSTRARVRWYEFNMNGWPDSGSNPSVKQWGEIDLGGDIHTYFGSIAVDNLGNAALTFARSSSTEYISMSRAVRAYSDPLNTFQDPVIVQESTAAHTSGRWGDYSFTQADPNDEPGVFWGHHEFCTGGGSSWRTWIAQYVVSPGLTLAIDPLIAGQNGTFTTTNATPLTKVYLIYSLSGAGSTYVPALDVTLGLASPKLGGSSTSNASGTAVLVKMVPLAAKNRIVWFQSAEYGIASNVVKAQIN